MRNNFIKIALNEMTRCKNVSEHFSIYALSHIDYRRIEHYRDCKEVFLWQ